MIDARETFGDIDIYLFDQILKNRFRRKAKILDLGCGTGRNLIYFIKSGFEVYGVDMNPDAISHLRDLAKELEPTINVNKFFVGSIEDCPFENEEFDAAICSAVFHFASDEEHFNKMFEEAWRILAPGGLFFARLASNIGMEDRVKKIKERVYLLPDGTERFLVDQEYLLRLGDGKAATLLEPIKTTNVQNLRAMTTWVLRKPIGK